MTAYITLPRPISVNGLFANVAGKGRVKSAAYNTWLWQAQAALVPQRPLPVFITPVRVTIYLGEVGVGMMDADNAAKAVMDCLSTQGVIKDDSRKHVRSVNLCWVPDMAGTVVRISPSLAEIPASLVVEMADAAKHGLPVEAVGVA